LQAGADVCYSAQMTTSTRIAVLRISFGALREKYETEDAGEGWSSFKGADGARLDVKERGSALLVRLSGAVGGLSTSFGELWRLHAEPRGVAVHDRIPDGDDYDSLVEGASWEGGLFSQAASVLGGGKPAIEGEPRAGDQEAEASEGGAGDPFDAVANKFMSAVAKRSSRKVLAARLAAEKGQKDLGDVLDAMESEEAEGEDALMSGVEGRFAFDVEHQEMARLVGSSLETGDAEEKSDADEAEAEPRAGDAPSKSGE
jgi:hypothetical protein